MISGFTKCEFREYLCCERRRRGAELSRWCLGYTGWCSGEPDHQRESMDTVGTEGKVSERDRLEWEYPEGAGDMYRA
jgi:hypothetical protein